MINKRHYLYGREVVDDVTELDYLQTELFNAELRSSTEITVTDATAFRPDLISQRAYANFHYAWLIMDYNDILDPYEELTTGTVLKIPNLEDYFQFFNDASRISKEDRN